MSISRRRLIHVSAAAGLSTLAMPGIIRAADGGKITIATEAAYPPFNQTSPGGQITGYEPDMLAELAKRQGFEYELVPQAWDGMIQGLIDGKYNAVTDAVTITPAREKVVDFSLPYTSGGSAFVLLKDSGITLPGTGTEVNLSDKEASEAPVEALAKALKGKIVAVETATIQSDFLDTYLKPKGVTIRTYQNNPDSYQDLLNGRADVLMSDLSNLSAFLKQHGQEAEISGPTLGGGLMGHGSGIAVQKGDTKLKAMFDAGLKSMSDDGTLTKLSIKWFGMDISQKL